MRINIPAFCTIKRRIATKASIMRILVSMAFWLLRTEGNIDTPYSVKAKGVVVECFKVLNRSQFGNRTIFVSIKTVGNDDVITCKIA